MSKAGKTMLLATIFFLLSGAKLHAQGLSSLPLMKISQDHTCTAIHSYFVAYDTACVERKLTQVEIAVKAAVEEDEAEKPSLYSHTVEPIYYVEPTPTPVTEIPLTTPTTPPPAVLTDGARDMVPQIGVQVDANVIFDLINAHRVSIGKPVFLKDEALCSLATTRSMELSAEFANGSLHSGLYNRNLPYWVTEDAKWGSNESGTVRWWLNSPIHRAAIEGSYTYSCGACNGSQCAQLFTSYTPKQTIPQTASLPVAPQE